MRVIRAINRGPLIPPGWRDLSSRAVAVPEVLVVIPKLCHRPDNPRLRAVDPQLSPSESQPLVGRQSQLAHRRCLG